MRKRLALGRCLAGRPKVVLLDEPFSSLDVDAKHEMYTIIQSLWLILKCSFVIVTHDIHEAIILSHKVFISSPLPMRKKAEVNISFDYPREEMLSKTNEYMELSNKIRELLT
jgi:ABC-type nitrate/sulfonate/bicarbonate transport system ATPase subunit